MRTLMAAFIPTVTCIVFMYRSALQDRQIRNLRLLYKSVDARRNALEALALAYSNEVQAKDLLIEELDNLIEMQRETMKHDRKLIEDLMTSEPPTQLEYMAGTNVWKHTFN